MNDVDASLYEAPFEYVVKHVKLERENNNRKVYGRYWWRHGEPRIAMRFALTTLHRYIAISAVSKHIIFTWVHGNILPDKALIVFARDDDATFGILHSRFHELWSLAQCTWMGKGNDPRYTPTTCFETFPFPAGLTPNIPAANYAENSHAKTITEAAVDLNQKRENWLNPLEWVEWIITPEEEQAGYPKRPVAKTGYEADLKKCTLTNLYNTRPAWLDMAHKTLDKAVAAAYGWTDYTPEMSDDEILRRLLVLNLERSKVMKA